jgi:hypothetical protein
MYTTVDYINITLIVITIMLYLLFMIVCDGLKNIIKVLRLKKPGLIFISLRQGDDGMLKFVLVLPAAGAKDVVARELRFTVGDVSQEVDLEGDAVETAEFSGADNEKVVGTLVDVDDAGNRSETREFSFVLADTLPPPQPGVVGLKLTGEE